MVLPSLHKVSRVLAPALLILFSSACGWVDSTGTQPEIAQLGATGTAGNNTVSLIEETEKILDLSSFTTNTGVALKTQTWRRVAEGGLQECATVFDINQSATSLNAACSPEESSCRLFIVPLQTNSTDQYSLLPPKLARPVGLKYDWQFITPNGSIQHTDVTFCLDAVNEAPKANDDNYQLDAGQTLQVAGRNYDNNCNFDQTSPGLLSNDIDDADSRFGCLESILVTYPQFAANDFTGSFTAGGGFNYTPRSGVTAQQDRFTYRLYDGEYYSEQATVVLTLTRSATAPQANDDTYSVSRNSRNNTFFPMSNDVDPERIDIDIASIAQQPDRGGSVRVQGSNRILYSPVSGFTGVESFGYTIVNDSGELATATITVNVL